MSETLARYDTAFVEAESPTFWRIGNELIGLIVSMDERDGWEVSVVNHATAHVWTGERAFALTWNGTRLDGRNARVVKTHAEDDGAAVRFVATLALADDLVVEAHYRLAPDVAVVQTWLDVRPQAAGTLEAVRPLDLSLIHADDVWETSTYDARVRWVRGVQDQGGWRPNEGTYNSFKLEERPLGMFSFDSGPRSTWWEIPWFAISHIEDNESVFVGLQYGARWAAHFAREGGMSVALDQVGIAVELESGARWTAPRAFIGVFSGDMDEAAAAQIQFYRTQISPPLPRDFPWVQYNTWFSYGCDFDDEALRREVAIAADVGAELFYIDAGWWTNNPRKGDNFSSGLGNWTENPDKFPDGLRAFADHVRDNDMHFGIWVEPERVDVRTLATGTWQEEWLTIHDDAFVRAHWPADTETAWLCFGNAATQAWAVDWISAMVEAYDVRWLKWDSNYWGVCTSPDHGHGVGDGEAHQIDGVLRVMRELRRRFPNLIIENCAGGGTRMDFAFAEQTHTAWIDDATEPSHRVRFHLAGASYVFPPEVLNTWVSESKLEDLNGRRLPRPTLESIFRSRMLGAFGISCRMVEWPTVTREVMRESIAEYKRLRPMLRAGRIYHLLPQPELLAPRLQTPAAWEAYQVYDAATARGAVLVFRGMATDSTRTIALKGLDPQTSYVLAAASGEEVRGTGADLMRDKLSVTIAPLTSALYWLVEA